MAETPTTSHRSVAETGVDALAVAVGTAHGNYTTRKPHIDLKLLMGMSARTRRPSSSCIADSDVPAEWSRPPVRLPDSSISKVNIHATSLQHAHADRARASKEHISAKHPPARHYPGASCASTQDAVERVVAEKIEAFLGSRDRAAAFAADAA